MIDKTKKRRAGRKIVVLITVLVMFFSIGLFAACDIDSQPTLEQRIDAVGQSVYTMQNGGNPTTQDIDELLAELASLRAEVQRLQGENAALLARIDSYTSQLNELRDDKEAERLSADFVLNITVSTTTLQHGQNLTMEAVFKNQSGEQADISHTQSWIMPFINNVPYAYGTIDINHTVLGTNKNITRTLQIGRNLPRGTHVLTARATFGLLLFEDSQIIDESPIQVTSNTIIITVA